MPGPAQIVTGPPLVARNDGLRGARGLSVLENPPDPLDPQRRWTRGYRFNYGPCQAGFTLDPCELEGAVPVHGPAGERWIEPFVVAVDRSCSTWGWEAADYPTEAARLLDANQYAIIARELWRGDQAIASGWVDPDPDPGTGGPGNTYLAGDWDPEWVNLIEANGGDPEVDSMSPVEGLAALEQALTGCSVGPGVIHMTVRLATILFAEGALRSDGARIFTYLGTQVVADGAYDGSGPDSLGKPDATALREWAYATGPVTIRIDTGEPFLTPPADAFEQAVDRANNNIEFLAQRKASVSWGCCHIGTAITPISDDLVPAVTESGSES
jgi:hypothetical protein